MGWFSSITEAIGIAAKKSSHTHAPHPASEHPPHASEAAPTPQPPSSTHAGSEAAAASGHTPHETQIAQANANALVSQSNAGLKTNLGRTAVIGAGAGAAYVAYDRIKGDASAAITHVEDDVKAAVDALLHLKPPSMDTLMGGGAMTIALIGGGLFIAYEVFTHFS